MPAAPRVQNTRYESNAEVNAKANRSAAWKDQDEARSQPLIPLNTGRKYVFRLRPGTYRKPMFRIPTLPDDFRNEKQERVYTERFNKRALARSGDKPKYDLAAVRNAVGGEYIIFQPIPGGDDRQGSGFFATDSEDVYQYLMERKRNNPNGVMQHVFVEYPQRTITVNGRTVPATTAGWEAAQEAFMADDVPQE